ncbi:TnsA-like heteromeric transposase endonuclease subunit [Streptomyces sp. NPDC058751]|uniref:TnsA-like heteromeric transposase endonuclease subunit n=1 Tax=Streptomyces sp. NPDC058751 TaxID=3346623 RepID=UPI003687F229
MPRSMSGIYWRVSINLRYRTPLAPTVVVPGQRRVRVAAMASQPFRLSWRDGGRVRYTPDYFVRHRDGTVVVLDVRPDDLIPPDDVEKFAVTTVACAQVGWGYERAGVQDPVLAANLRRLSGYRHPRGGGSRWWPRSRRCSPSRAGCWLGPVRSVIPLPCCPCFSI